MKERQERSRHCPPCCIQGACGVGGACGVLAAQGWAAGGAGRNPDLGKGSEAQLRTWKSHHVVRILCHLLLAMTLAAVDDLFGMIHPALALRTDPLVIPLHVARALWGGVVSSGGERGCFLHPHRARGS